MAGIVNEKYEVGKIFDSGFCTIINPRKVTIGGVDYHLIAEGDDLEGFKEYLIKLLKDRYVGLYYENTNTQGGNTVKLVGNQQVVVVTNSGDPDKVYLEAQGHIYLYVQTLSGYDYIAMASN